MRDYIAEANYFMYDDNYVVETEMEDYKYSLEHRKKQLKSAQQRNDQAMIKYWTHMVQAANEAIRLLNASEQRKSKKMKSDKDEANKMSHSHDHNSVLKDSERHINKIGKEIQKHENNMDKRGRKGDLANEFDFHRSQHDYDHDEHKKLHYKIKSAHEKGEKVSDGDIKKLKKHIELGRDMIEVAKSNENIKDNW